MFYTKQDVTWVTKNEKEALDHGHIIKVSFLSASYYIDFEFVILIEIMTIFTRIREKVYSHIMKNIQFIREEKDKL